MHMFLFKALTTLCVWIVIHFSGLSSEASASDAEKAMRIHPSQVTLDNVEAFKKQLTGDLPPGTPKGDVEKYIHENGIACRFFDKSYNISQSRKMGNVYHCTIDNIGRYMDMFVARLAIRIQLDDDDAVERVWFRTEIF